MAKTRQFSFVDLFSGAGGMSYGFHRHKSFKLIAAADAEIGKPSMGEGSLQCNSTYALNMGFEPKQINLAEVELGALRRELRLSENQKLSVLSVCPPCTGFSRANPQNHLEDDRRNSLVQRAAEFVEVLDPEVVVMENARELLRGNFRSHFDKFKERLEELGYRVSANTYFLSKFGVPQIRERAIVIASKTKYSHHTLEDLWAGWQIKESALTVRSAFKAISKNATGISDYPGITNDTVKSRMEAIPKNGGSWAELIHHPDGNELMTPAMKRIVAKNKLGSHPDVYGRMSWDKPAPTIKRECAHVGNGRYAHPVEDRLCSIREMAMLQGFPNEFSFEGSSMANKYRHIGDAVPPLLSYQLAHVANWILTEKRPELEQVLLSGTQLSKSSLVETDQMELLLHA
ncbi:MAG: DNA cytosine methyltransferase [Verrucomicrobiales bacterium]|nr:DNA cytosine methyltransferase [Verrucomicrobiales bacterium]